MTSYTESDSGVKDEIAPKLQQSYDLKNAKDLKALSKICDLVSNSYQYTATSAKANREIYNQLIKKSNLTDYLKSGKMPITTIGENPLFNMDGTLISIKDGIVYRMDYEYDIATTKYNEQEVCGFILETPITIGKTTYQKTLIMRGDDGYNDLVEHGDFLEFPTISINCISQMLYNNDDRKNLAKVIKAVSSGTFKIVDFIPDQREKLTATQKKQLAAFKKNAKKNKPPVGKPGFTLIGQGKGVQWHMAASVLFTDGESSYIFGQDEGTYFGCKLKDNPTTVAGAFDSLEPDTVKGKSYIRQGEWFVVPVKEGPAIPDSIVTGETMTLPLESEDSNDHVIYANERGIRVDKNGQIFALNATLEHSDHKAVEWRGWATFHRNTAVKSVSADAAVD